jgi:membrane protein YqaA with SNARE-associated domain
LKERNKKPEMIGITDVHSGANEHKILPTVGKKFLSILFIIGVLAISIMIYIYKDKVQTLGNFGYLGVILLCFICNATILAPAPSLVVVVSMALVMNPMIVAISGAIGSTLGETVGYYSGYVGKNIIDFDNNKLASWVKKYGTPVVFIFAVIPLPLFDIIGLASGYLRIKLYKFFIACFAGKLIKMLVYSIGANYFAQYLTR